MPVVPRSLREGGEPRAWKGRGPGGGGGGQGWQTQSRGGGADSDILTYITVGRTLYQPLQTTGNSVVLNAPASAALDILISQPRQTWIVSLELLTRLSGAAAEMH